MDIERLKELSDYLRVANELSTLNDEWLMQRIIDNNDVANTIDIAIELLDAEIARQSVSDEETEKLLEELQETVDSWEEWLEEDNFETSMEKREFEEDIKREKRLLAIINKHYRKPDPCEWCTDEVANL